MKVAIIGTRGIPNNYGGFEQCAEYLALGLVKKGFDVTVYNSHSHPYKENEWNGVKIVHCYDPEDKFGTIGQFLYDLNCILDCRKKNFDVILQLGYTSNAIWGRFLPKKSVITTNMDGLEWKRTKYSRPVKNFLQYSEKLAIKHSNYLIADSVGIQDYLEKKYSEKSTFIPYGANLFENPDIAVLEEFNLKPYNYNLLIARLEPENSIQIILDGIVLSGTTQPFLVIGKHDTKYGKQLKEKFLDYPIIKFIGGIYNIKKLDTLRYFSNLYFHGHTVGGTNPSLLEAMASNCLICANDNPFNKYILGNDAVYFTVPGDIQKTIRFINKDNDISKIMLINNRTKIRDTYSWDAIVNQYAGHLQKIIK
jgi:glycosyltransferase involved in cell wall biosynthesis